MLQVASPHIARLWIDPESSDVEYSVRQLTLCRSFKSQPIEIVLLESKSGVWDGAYVQVGEVAVGNEGGGLARTTVLYPSGPMMMQLPHDAEPGCRPRCSSRMARTTPWYSPTAPASVRVRLSAANWVIRPVALSGSAADVDVAAGGVSPVQQVGAGPSDCLSSASFNLTQQLFSFNASGSTGECDGNFRLIWDGTPNQGPYNVSIIPLDGGYAPWVIPLQSGSQHYDWQVNLTAGSYFTVMMK